MVTTENLNTSNEINKKTNRQSNFELLRIFSMILILASHWGWIFLKVDINSLSRSRQVFYNLFRSCGQVGVVLFVLISGYFMCTKKFNIMGIIKLFTQIVCLNLIALLAAFIFSKTVNEYNFSFSLPTLINLLFPLQGGYWFVLFYSFSFVILNAIS